MADVNSKDYSNKYELRDNYGKNKSQIPPKFTFISKFSFALAGLPYQMYFCAIGVYATVFLLDRAKLSPSSSTYVLFISRIMDAVTDPIYGFLVDKTKPNRFGRLMPWVVISFPLSALCYIMMWYIPEGFSQDQLFYWFLIWYSLIFTVLTGVRIPHTSMTMYLTDSQEERQSATIFRMGFEMIGILLALGIQGPFVIGNPCNIPADLINNLTNSTANFSDSLLTNSTAIASTQISFWEEQKFVILAAILTLIFIFGNVMLIIFVKERLDLGNSDESKKDINLFKELKQVFTFKPYVILVVASIFNTLSIQIMQSNLQLYFEYGYYQINDLFTYTILGLLILAILFVPLWQFFMRRFGKKICFIAGNCALFPLLISVFFLSQRTTVQIVIFFVFTAIGSSAFTVSFLVPWAMLPEAADAYFLKYKTRPDAIFYTYFVLGTKVLIAAYLGLSVLVLEFVNYKNNICAQYQDERVPTTIKLLLSPGPFIFFVISSIFIYFYPIDEKTALENTNRISQITQAKQKVSTIEDENGLVMESMNSINANKKTSNGIEYDNSAYNNSESQQFRF